MFAKKYAQIYMQYINTGVAESTTYRLHFTLVVVMDMFFYASNFLTADFIYDHVNTIGPWERNQFMFFISFMLCIDQMKMTFISNSFWRFTEDIRMGSLDFVLIKPVNALFALFFREFKPASLINGVATFGLLFYFGSLNGLTWISWLALPFLLLSGFFLLLGVEITFAMSAFWLTENMGVNFMRMKLVDIARWPDFIYGFYARKLFLVFIPVLLTSSAPVRFLLDNSNWNFLLYVALGLIGVGSVVGLAWKSGLRKYESASS